MRRAFALILLGLCVLSSPLFSQDPGAVYVAQPQDQKQLLNEGPGDRVHSEMAMQTVQLDAASIAAAALTGDYVLGPGDVLLLRVRGKVDLHYGGSTDPRTAGSIVPSTASPDTYEVKPDGTLHLPMIGQLQAAGKTVDKLKTEVKEKLSEYYKQFTVELSVSRPGLIKVWVSGQVTNPGPQALPSTATVLEALLRADIRPEGSTRLVKLTRGGKTRIIDVYGIVSAGNVSANATLAPGDQIFVPGVTDWIKVTGEVVRPGRYEMLPAGRSKSSECKISDIVGLSLGLLPTAAKSKVVVERSTPSGEVTAIHCDLSGSDNIALRPGDKVVIPSVADYQPTVRLVGEFKGEGVYQRMAAGTVLNKSGVYKLAAGETVGDVITRTGGTTPQADLKRAKIERRRNGEVESIDVDLDRLLMKSDRSADVVLQSGDTLILPALQEKVYVFGQVSKPGGFSYEPDRRALDYLAYAGGPAARAKSDMVLVRNKGDKPQMTKLSLKSSMKGNEKDNPVVQPGDIIYVPEGIITDWRDLSQLITTVRLLALF